MEVSRALAGMTHSKLEQTSSAWMMVLAPLQPTKRGYILPPTTLSLWMVPLVQTRWTRFIMGLKKSNPGSQIQNMNGSGIRMEPRLIKKRTRHPSLTSTDYKKLNATNSMERLILLRNSKLWISNKQEVVPSDSVWPNSNSGTQSMIYWILTLKTTLVTSLRMHIIKVWLKILKWQTVRPTNVICCRSLVSQL